MAWLSRNNIAPTDSLTADMLNSLANDIRYWGGDVNGGGYRLSNVVMSGTGGFERIPSPAIIAPVVMDGLAQIQFVDFVAGVPDPTYPPRWTLTKKALPTPDFAIDRFSAGGSFLDEPFMIRAVDGVIVMKAQEWTGPINGGGQTITNVVLGPSVIAGAQTPWRQNIEAAKFLLNNVRGIYTENVAVGAAYSSAGFLIYEALSGGAQTANESPRIAFYHQGRDASQIGYDASIVGIRTWTAAGTGYAPFAASFGLFAGTASPSYGSAGVQVYPSLRESGINDLAHTPRVAFRWEGVGAVQIGAELGAASVRTFNANGDGYAAFACAPLRLQTSWAINLDVTGKHTLAGPAVMFYCEPGGGGSAFMAFAPTNAAGSSVSWHSFPLNISTGAFRIGAIQIGKVQVDSGYFYPQKMVQYDWAYHAWNMEESTGQWRLMEAGYGNVITSSLGDGNLRIYTSLSGAAGGVASLVPTAAFGPTQITFIATQVNQREISAGASATYVFQSAAGLSQWQTGMGGSPGNYAISRFDDAGAYIDNPLTISRATGHTSFNNHEINTLARLNLNNTVSGSPSVTLFNTGALSTFGIGIEANAIFYITGLNSLHRWYHGTADGGATDLMELASNKLTINVPTDMKGNLDMGGFTISNIGGAGAGFVTTFNTRTGAVVSVLGDYPPAKLGTGTPDSTKYLRGDGTWQVPPGSAGGEPQTPWTRAIDANFFQLYNAKNIITAGTSVDINYYASGLIIHEANYGGSQSVDPGAAPRLTFWWSGVDAYQIGIGDGGIRTFNAVGDGYINFSAGWGVFSSNFANVNIDGVGLTIREYKRLGIQGYAADKSPRIAFYWANVAGVQFGLDPGTYGIRTFNLAGDDYVSLGASKFICPNTIDWKLVTYSQCGIGIEAGTQYYSVFPGGIHRWYVGSSNIMETTANTFTLNTSIKSNGNISVHANSGVVLNAEYTDQWRYIASGAAFYMGIQPDRVRFLVGGANGTAGAGVSFAETMSLTTGSVDVKVPLVINYSGRGVVLQGVNELDIDFYITNAGTNVKRSRIMAYSSGYIALNTLDDAYTMITSRFELYNNKVNSDQPICVTGGAIYAPNLNGLHLGFDGASGMVAAINNPTAWKPLYLRGSNVNVEAQGGVLWFAGTASFNSSLTQTIPSSQSDPGNFGSMSGAHYVYFDPATKKLVLRYHEGGVAFRNYILKEGDQGTGTTLVNDTANSAFTAVVGGSYTALKQSVAIPAGSKTIRLQITLWMVGQGGATKAFVLGASTGSYAAGTGSIATWNQGYASIWSTTGVINSSVVFDLTISQSGASTFAVSGMVQVDGGAIQYITTASCPRGTYLTFAIQPFSFNINITSGNYVVTQFL
jgi:hypothetical protein